MHVDRVRQAVRRGGRKAIDGVCRGDVYENAMCEPFFASWNASCSLPAASRHRRGGTAVFDFIEGFYNPRRRHSALGYPSPIEYQRRAPEGGIACPVTLGYRIFHGKRGRPSLPIYDATGSTCASRTLSGARWSARLPPSIPSLHVDSRCPKRSATCWSLTPALCSESTLRGRCCATHRAASRTGSAGVWRELSAPLHPADESRAPEARDNQSHGCDGPQTLTRPRNRGRSREGPALWPQSEDATSELVFDRDVRVEERGLDRYGRTIGRVFVGETDVSLEFGAAGGRLGLPAVLKRG